MLTVAIDKIWGLEKKVYLIYPDNANESDDPESYFGTYLDAHEYARKKHGKYYVIHEKTKNT